MMSKIILIGLDYVIYIFMLVLHFEVYNALSHLKSKYVFNIHNTNLLYGTENLRSPMGPSHKTQSFIKELEHLVQKKTKPCFFY